MSSPFHSVSLARLYAICHNMNNYRDLHVVLIIEGTCLNETTERWLAKLNALCDEHEHVDDIYHYTHTY